MRGYESLDRVVRRVLAVVEEGQETIFSMAEAARSNLERLQPVLEAAAEREAAVPVEPLEKSQDRLEQERDNLMQVIGQADLLLTRFGVAMQCLQGEMPEGDLAEIWPGRKQVGQLVIRILDNERRRIAREIHDGPAQALANILLRMVFCEKRLAQEPAAVRDELLSLKEVIRASLQDIRKILFDLRPEILDQGLICGLHRLFGDFREQYGLQVTFTCSGREQHLDSPAAGAILRIVQEGLNNVYKHSGSDHALVRLELEERQVTVQISDEGKGFDLQGAPSNNGHYGLMNMQERARLLDGMLQIKTAPGKGTKVIVTIPIAEGEEGRG